MGPSTGINLFSAALLVGAAQGLFLAVATFFGGKSLSRASAYLAGLMLAFVFELLFRFVIVTGYITYLPNSLATYWALDLFYGPLVYLYTQELTSIDSQHEPRRSLGHFVLPITGMVFALVLGFTSSGPSFLATLDGTAAPTLAVAQGSLAYGSIVSMIGYLCAGFQLLHRHVANVTSNFSYLEKRSLRWLRNLLIVLTTLLALYLFFAMAELDSPVLYQLYPLAIVIAVFAIGFLGIKQPAVFDQQILEQYVLPGAVVPRKRAVGGRKIQQVGTIRSRCQAGLSRDRRGYAHRKDVPAERPFAANARGPPKPAQPLCVPGHQPRFRLELLRLRQQEANQFVTRRLTKAESAGTWNILDLAMESGFNSKTAFYKAFRNITGQTPKQYQNSVTNRT